MMEVASRPDAGALALSVRGRLDASWAPRLEAEIGEALRRGAHHLRLDLAEVSYVSSAGIRVLVMATKQLRAIGGSLAITAASPQVRSVLELSGMEELLCGAPQPEAAPAGPPFERVVAPGLSLQVFRLDATEPLRCALVGEPDALGGAAPAAAVPVALGPDALAVGIGALGEEAEGRERFGELIAAGGAAAFAPTDGADLPDYVVSAGTLVPRALLLAGAVCRGDLSLLVRFEADPGGSVVLTALIQALLALAGGPAGMVVLAESDGLLGAALKRSPALLPPGESIFSHPGLRRWLSYTPERQHRRALALVAGIVAPAGDTTLGRYARPLGAAGPQAHLHAMALPFAPLPRGPIALGPTVARLLDVAAPLAVLHLLRDDRELAGGDSAFLRGAAWLGRLDQVTRGPA